MLRWQTFCDIVVLTIVILLYAIIPNHVFADPPTNFQRTLLVGSNLNAPTGLGIAPDGRIFILERAGAVKIYKNGALLPTPFTTLPSAASGDRGLAGITFDPNFLQNHYVYFYYTDAVDLHNKLVRFDASTDTAQNGPVVLYQTTDQSFQLHIGGTIAFGPDGKLYISIGDNGTFPNAQDLTNPHGKIIRLNPDGTIPTDNPFYNTPNASKEIWAYGFRNPFRFSFDSANGNLYVGDVGEATTEEIDHVTKGKNYGWPNCEGPCSPPNSLYTDPIYSWNHDPNIAGGSAASVAGPVYRGQMFPTSYVGQLFFGDYAQGWIKTMALDSNGNNAGVTSFDPNVGSVTDMKIDPKDGSLYYTTIFPGALYQVTYSTTGNKLTVNASANTTSGPAPLTVNFSSSGTNSSNNDPLSYNWDFGDGTSSTSPNPSHTYNNPGRFTVQLKVTDGTLTDLAVPIVVQVGTPPTVTINSPANNFTYKAGDTINYSISAKDSNGNSLSGNNVQTTIVFHHQTHIHPFLGPLSGTSGSFVIPTTGETSAQTWYEIDSTATDSNGLATTVVTQIHPQTVNLTFNTVVSGLQILLDGIPTTTTYATQGVVNFVRTLSVPVLQQLNNVWYTFHSWSDNGAVAHIISTPGSDTTYTANFDTAASFTGQYFSNQNLSGSPTLTRQDPAIQFDWGSSGSPDPSIPHNQFSVRWIANQFFSSGTYDFTTTSDDGVRLYIDNNLVIDQWHDQGTASYTVTVPLTTGNHQIKLEYYQAFGGAVAKLTWALSSSNGVVTPSVSPTTSPTPSVTPTVTPSPTPTAAFTGQYWNLPGTSSSPTIPNTPPDFTRQDSVIAFVWNGTASPDPSITHDHFAARWKGSFVFPAGTYQFTIKADDGVRFLVDGQTVTDQWHDEGMTVYTPSVTLSGGVHTIQMDYYQDTGGAVAELDMPQQAVPVSPTPTLSPTPSLSPTPTPTPSSTYLGQYWNVPGTTSSPTIPNTPPTFTRQDSTINFTWNNTASPDPSITHDHFAARWTRTINFPANDMYQFTIKADDGVRFLVDGNNLVDQWHDEGLTVYTPSIQLSAGNHTIQMDYYQDTGGAVAELDLPYQLTNLPNPSVSPTPISSNLLTSPWHVTATGSTAGEAYQTVVPTILQNKTSLIITYDLHGVCLLSGDASALIFDQNGWKMVSLSQYGNNCQDGTQTVTIPLSNFKDINTQAALDTNAPLDGKLHIRLWNGATFTVDVSSITLN